MAKRRSAEVGLVVGSSCLAAGLLAPSLAEAEDFSVTNLNDSGFGSLRAAIENANATASADRILFESSLSGTITLTVAAGDDLDITNPVEIIGPGADQVSVSGNNQFRVFNFYRGAGEVSLSGLTVTGGVANQYRGGGILSGANLTVADSVITGNRSPVSLADGGGIAAYDGSLRLESSTVSANQAPNAGGGGVFITNTDAPSVISGSTLVANRALLGGGSYFAELDAPITIESSTISGNTAPPSSGGGLNARAASPGKELTVANSTISGNTGGGFDIAIGTAALRSTIVADNEGADLDGGQFQPSFSLIEDPGTSLLIDPRATIIGADPGLEPLSANGGPTLTHALTDDSPAIDQGTANGLTTDQRGLARAVDFSVPNPAEPGADGTDIGAYERQAAQGEPSPPLCKGKVGTVFAPLAGTGRADVIIGTEKKDKIKAKGGKDLVCAGAGNDRVSGGPGKDRLFGGAGKDRLAGGGGKDTCKGGPGKDVAKSC